MQTVVTGFGERKTILEWSTDERCVVSMMTLRKRIYEGMSLEAAMTTESSANADRFYRKLEAFGEVKTIKNWALDSRAARDAHGIYQRLKRGYDPERAIAEPEHLEKRERKSTPKTYHSKTVAEWLKDPRCQVSRFTLERNFRLHMPPDQALVFRKRRPAKSEPSSVLISKQEALDLLGRGAELWRYEDGSVKRTSIIDRAERWEVGDDVFTELLDAGVIELDFRSSDSICAFKLKKRTEKREDSQGETKGSDSSRLML